MRHRPLGRTGISVSTFGLGTMVLGAWGNRDHESCERIIRTALDAGINLVDTADVYALGESEEIVGRALAGRRDEVVLATKFHNAMGDDPNMRGNSRRWINRAVDDSLRRLRTDRIDLYQVHRPDPTTDVSETIDALSDLVRAGKILAWGTSTFPAEEIVETCRRADARGVATPHTEQPPYSILCRGIERDVLPVCEREGMGVIVWSPLSGGWLTGKYRRDLDAPDGSRAQTNPDHFDADDDAKHDAVEALAPIAADAGLRLTEMALAWVVEHPAVTSALIGPRTPEQLDELLRAADVTLDHDVLDAIDRVVAPGTDLDPADRGWDPPGLAIGRRRRARGADPS
ncbi:aldo/keto reductase [Ilumatobacter sp.]|uniref:aldo/keto reductase n=1 Tax=Ilumatobacter sp. TaxID=1967498 RepID=UPI003B525362